MTLTWETKDMLTIDELEESWDAVTAEAAADETAREVTVRRRCFVRWVQEGRLSKSEAHDRLTRLIKAQQLLSYIAADPKLLDTIMQSGTANCVPTTG